VATGRTRLTWGAVAVGVIAMAAAACGGSTEPETETPTREPIAVVATQDAGDGQDATMQAYAD